MKCTQCETVLEVGSVFCGECGTRVEEQVQQTATPEMNQTVQETNQQVEVAKNWIGDLTHFFKALWKNPIMGVETIDQYIDGAKNVYLYLVALFVASAIVEIMTLTVFLEDIMDVIGIKSWWALMNATTQEKTGYLIESAIGGILLFIIFAAAIVGLYKMVWKYDIEMIDCIKLLLAPVMILIVGQAITFAALFISTKLAIITYMCAYTTCFVLIIIQLVKKLGLDTKVILVAPSLLIAVSALIQYLVA